MLPLVRSPKLFIFRGARVSDPVILPCYVETNTTDPMVLADYKLSSGKPTVDLGILFAANINGTPDAPVLTYNANLQKLLDAGVVENLLASGVRPSLSILGNHDSAGISALTDSGAQSFADQLADAVNTYGLLGLDFDDEYSTGPAIPGSFTRLLAATRARLPDTVLSMYAIGPAMGQLSAGGQQASQFLNMAWNPWYGSFTAPAIPGMTPAELSPAAIKFTAQSQAQAASLAQQTVDGGFGVCMMYNLLAGDQSAYFSAVTQVLYGQDTVYTP